MSNAPQVALAAKDYERLRAVPKYFSPPQRPVVALNSGPMSKSQRWTQHALFARLSLRQVSEWTLHQPSLQSDRDDHRPPAILSGASAGTEKRTFAVLRLN